MPIDELPGSVDVTRLRLRTEASMLGLWELLLFGVLALAVILPVAALVWILNRR